MPGIQIRDVPDEVHSQLVAQARARGQSLQAYLLALVSEATMRQRNVEVLARIERRSGGTSLSGEELQREIAENRSKRGIDVVPQNMESRVVSDQAPAEDESRPGVVSRVEVDEASLSSLLVALQRSVELARAAVDRGAEQLEDSAGEQRKCS